MKKSLLPSIVLPYLPFLIMLFGCNPRNPLDTPILPLPSITGNITVTILNGTTLVPGVGVYLLDPTGVGTTATSGTLPIKGQAIFPITKQGTYLVGLVSQPSTSPLYQKIPISTASPSANVTLQESGAYLSVTATDNNPQSYPGYIASHSYKVTYVNNSALQQDIVMNVDSSNFPSGWYVVIQNAFLHAGQSTIVNVYNGAFTGNTSVAIPFNAFVGNTVIANTTLRLARDWSLTLHRCYDFSYNGGGPQTVAGQYSLQGVSYTSLPGSWQLSFVVTSYLIHTASGTVVQSLPAPAYETVTDGSVTTVDFGTCPDHGNTAASYLQVNGYYTLAGIQFPFTDQPNCASGAWYYWECF
jgi:hypothetical protein